MGPLPHLAELAQLALTVVLPLLVAPADRLVHNTHWAVRMEAPTGWTVLHQSAYPNIIAVMKHPAGGQIVLAGQHARPGETARTLAERSRLALTRQNMRIAGLSSPAELPDAVLLEAQAADGKSRIRQIYLVHADTGFVLTLSAPLAKMDTYSRDFEAAWRSLAFLDEE